MSFDHNTTHMRRCVACTIAMVLAALRLFVCVASASEKDKMFVSLYGGWYSDTVFIENLQFNHDFDSSSIYVLSVGKPIARYRKLIAVELEGQLGFHQGRENHQEINGVITLRWLPFPWDPYLDTSFAFGNGLSYATADPVIEKENADNGQTAQFLYYLFAEWAFAMDSNSTWEIFWRLHHRSGVYGRMADNNAGANYVGVGIRRRF